MPSRHLPSRSQWQSQWGRRSPFVVCPSPTCFLVCLLFLSPYAIADPGGAISGAVLSRTGEPVASARISLVLPATRFRRELVSDESGKYAAAGLPPGTYTVTVRSVLTGAFTEEPAVVREGETLDLPLVLGEAPVAVSDLPLAARDALSLIWNRSEITPGQQGGNIEGNGPYGFRGNTSLNSYGQRGQNNGFLLDGLDNNGSWVRGAMMALPLDAVTSVTLGAGYIPAEFGHAAGAVVNLDTGAGSDRFHGDAFEYGRTTVLNARNFFDGANKPGLASNQFGGALSGPIRPGKWFFFFAPELRREREGLTVTSTVPTRAEKTGDFGAAAATVYDPLSIHAVGENLFQRTPFPNNRIPGISIPQGSRNLIALYPDPSSPGVADNYSFASDRILNSAQFDLRSDYVFSPTSKFFVRLIAGSADGRSPGALAAPAGMGFPAGSYAGSDSAQNADGVDTHETWQSGAVSHTATLSASLVNEFRAGISVSDLHTYAADRGYNASAVLSMPSLSANGLPNFSALGFASLGAGSAAPFAIREANYQLEDSVAWKTRRHSWRFGFQAIRRHVDGDASEWSSRGAFFFTPDFTSQPGIANTGDSIASLLLGYPSEVRRDVQFAPYRLRAWEWAGFAQDSFRLSRKLTVDAGVRYSLYPPVTEAAGRMVNFNFSLQAPALDQFAGQNGVGQYAGAGSNKHSVAPRIGFALDLSQNGSTVLRGSFSQAWDAGSYLASGSLARNPPFASRLDMVNGTFQVGPNLTAGLPIDSANGAIYAVEPANYTPYSDQWALSLGVRPRRGVTVEIGGMGSMGIHLPASYDANQPYPAPTPYAYPRYPFEPFHSRVEYLSFAGGSTYYGGVFKLTGSLFQLSYTYAKSLDDATAPGTDQQSRPAMPQNLYNPHGVRSPSPYDVAQRLVGTAHYDLAGWRIYAVVTLQTGLPFTPQLAVNSLNNGGFQLPNRIGDGSLPAGQRSYLQWFDTSAFAIPALYQYGNSGFDIVRGPGLANVDAALAKTIPLKEGLRLQLRVESFNLLNRTNYALPNRLLGLESTGVIDHTITPARRLQLAVRLEW